MFPLGQDVVRVTAGEPVKSPLGGTRPGPPVRETVQVFAWWIGGSSEGDESFHELRVKADASILAPAGLFTPGDVVVLPGHDGEFKVEGKAQNWDRNPWWSPGLDLVALKVVTG